MPPSSTVETISAKVAVDRRPRRIAARNLLKDGTEAAAPAQSALPVQLAHLPAELPLAIAADRDHASGVAAGHIGHRVGHEPQQEQQHLQGVVDQVARPGEELVVKPFVFSR